MTGGQESAEQIHCRHLDSPKEVRISEKEEEWSKCHHHEPSQRGVHLTGVAGKSNQEAIPRAS